MAKPRITLKEILAILEYHFETSMTLTNICKKVGRSENKVRDLIKKFKASGLTWPLDDRLSDDDLLAIFYPGNTATKSQLNWKELYLRARKQNLTCNQLWKQYNAVSSDNNCGRSSFFNGYKNFVESLPIEYQADNPAGQSIFVGWANDTAHIDGRGPCHIFIGVFGASGYTFAIATKEKDFKSWIDCHNEMFQSFGRSTQYVVPCSDYSNEDAFNYKRVARHYGSVVAPPSQDAHVSKGIPFLEAAQNYLFSKLPQQIYYSVADLNQKMEPIIDSYNKRRINRLDVTSKKLFDLLDSSARDISFQRPYEFAIRRERLQVRANHHVRTKNKHYYSVPHAYTESRVQAYISVSWVDIYSGDTQLCLHKKSDIPYEYTTDGDHMPTDEEYYTHFYLKHPPSRDIKWAEKIGEHAVALVEKIQASKEHPQQAYEICGAILSLGKGKLAKYEPEVLNEACLKALTDEKLEPYELYRTNIERIIEGKTPYRGKRNPKESDLDKLPY